MKWQLRRELNQHYGLVWHLYAPNGRGYAMYTDQAWDWICRHVQASIKYYTP